MLILNAEQIKRIVRESQPNNMEFHEMVDSLVCEYEGKCLGYGITKMVCSWCGAKSRNVHPVPIRFPAECVECHRMTCYEEEE